jgi:hypothetical protein
MIDSLNRKLVVALKKVIGIKKAVHKSEIPPKYRDLPVIGRGNTSIILDLDEANVIMLTRDAMKKDWLAFGLRFTDDWDEVDDITFTNYKFKDFPLYAIKMPKLFKLDGANNQKVNKEMAFWKKAFEEVAGGIYQYNTSKKWQQQETLSKLVEHYESNGMEDSMIHTVLEFLMDYNPDQWNFDIAKRQFAQDKEGNVILIDPIVDSDLVKIMQQ